MYNVLDWNNVFTIIGITFVICVICFVFWFCFFGLICSIGYKYKRKHRFDNPPIAKCYCIDCKYWNNGYCSYLKNQHTDDCWFCWYADPMSYNEYKDKSGISK